jgi:hypothetical protein
MSENIAENDLDRQVLDTVSARIIRGGVAGPAGTTEFADFWPQQPIPTDLLTVQV